MAAPLSPELLGRLSERLAAQLGLQFADRRRSDLERALPAISRDLGLHDELACVDWLLAHDLNRAQVEILARHLTIGETYFFREPGLFAVLEERILPELFRRKQAERRLRIWSAGCASGEEPYSLAILLDKLLADRSQWQITILATDINPQALQKASAGVYTEWSFRDTPEWVKSYFSSDGHKRFRIAPRIKEWVRFQYLNLVEDVYPSLSTYTNAMDLILCRNVLMYFAPEQSRRVAVRFHATLTEGGWLAVSPSELSTTTFSGFESVPFSGAHVYKKDSSRPAPGTEDLYPLAPFQAAPPAAPPADLSFQEPSPLPAFEVGPRAREREETHGAEPQPGLLEQAEVLYHSGDYVRAAQMLDLLVESGLHIPAMILLARSYANLGRLDQARAWAEKAAAQQRLDPRLYYLLATICQEQSDVECARLALQRALYLDSGLVLAHFALGMLESRQQRPRQAEKHLANALALLGNHAQDEILPESEGMTAGRMAEVVRAMLVKEQAA